MATEREEPERLCIWDKLFQTDGPVGQSHADSASVHSNSKHWFTTSFLQGRCRKAMLGVWCSPPPALSSSPQPPSELRTLQQHCNQVAHANSRNKQNRRPPSPCTPPLPVLCSHTKAHAVINMIDFYTTHKFECHASPVRSDRIAAYKIACARPSVGFPTRPHLQIKCNASTPYTPCLRVVMTAPLAG